jgi:predicted nucleic-acid-binding Zn-ribbon protein
MNISKCAKCGSTKIMPDIQVFDQGQHSDGRLKVVIAEEPNALIFKRNKLTALRAQICGECGYTELAVEDPHMLYEAYLKSREP